MQNNVNLNQNAVGILFVNSLISYLKKFLRKSILAAYLLIQFFTENNENKRTL